MDYCRKYGIVWGDIFRKIWVYIFGDRYISFRTQRAMCKFLKGGYVVVRDSKKHELVRGKLKVGFLKIDHGDMVYDGKTAIATRIEFYTKDRELVFWQEL